MNPSTIYIYIVRVKKEDINNAYMFCVVNRKKFGHGEWVARHVGLEKIVLILLIIVD